MGGGSRVVWGVYGQAHMIIRSGLGLCTWKIWKAEGMRKSYTIFLSNYKCYSFEIIIIYFRYIWKSYWWDPILMLVGCQMSNVRCQRLITHCRHEKRYDAKRAHAKGHEISPIFDRAYIFWEGHKYLTKSLFFLMLLSNV